VKRALLLAAALAAVSAPTLAMAQDFVITNATVALGDGSAPIEHGTVVVQGGKVVAAGAGVSAPTGATVIDGAGKWVTPGLFATVTDLGLWDSQGVEESNDTSAAKSPFNAALDIAPAINPDSQAIKIAREGGVTRATVSPDNGGSIFAGQGALIDLGADPRAVTRARAFQFVNLGESGGKLAGGSRAAAQALFRNALREARDFGGQASGRARPAMTKGGTRDAVDTGDDIPLDPRLGAGGSERGTDVLLTHFDAAALVPVVDGRQPLYVAVERASDIRAALQLKREFPKLDMVLVGATEGWLVARDIAAAQVPVIAMALNDLPARFEKLAATQSNIGRMKAAGVKVAIGMFGGDNQPRYAPQEAGNLVAVGRLPGGTGLTWGEALAAITSVPAEISGMAGKAGVLKAGAAGDVVIWDGDPLELSSAPTKVFIDGIEQPLDNHQSRLKQRYQNLDTSTLPKAYDW
jgi:imidazolonepropionase-like amidohydrolase